MSAIEKETTQMYHRAGSVGWEWQADCCILWGCQDSLLKKMRSDQRIEEGGGICYLDNQEKSIPGVAEEKN